MDAKRHIVRLMQMGATVQFRRVRPGESVTHEGAEYVVVVNLDGDTIEADFSESADSQRCGIEIAQLEGEIAGLTLAEDRIVSDGGRIPQAIIDRKTAAIKRQSILKGELRRSNDEMDNVLHDLVVMAVH